MSRDYVDLKIDTDRHKNGQAVADRLRGKERKGGIPWMVITDAAGQELVASDGPEGNIGCPMTEAERAWFGEMIRKTEQHMSKLELGTLEHELEVFAEDAGH